MCLALSSSSMYSTPPMVLWLVKPRFMAVFTGASSCELCGIDSVKVSSGSAAFFSRIRRSVSVVLANELNSESRLSACTYSGLFLDLRSSSFSSEIYSTIADISELTVFFDSCDYRKFMLYTS